MHPKIRVLIVDDSVVVRRLLSEILSSDPGVEVVGTAATGALALSKIPLVNPDVVTLDVEMPDKDGLETLAEIRKLYPRLPVVMFSSVTERAAAATLTALSLGASDYVTKPSASGGREASTTRVKQELLPKLHALVDSRSHRTAPADSPRRPVRVTAQVGTKPISLLAIGASTGGPNALASLFGSIPSSLPVPVVITQHMPPLFTRLLAERLSAGPGLRFHEATGGETLQPGHAYIAPGDYHLRVIREHRALGLALDKSAPENSCRPSVDVMLRSIAEICGETTLAVILTGMGQDGLRGCEQIKAKGGQLIAQDRASSVVWGMPGFVAEAGIADAVLPLDEIAKEILARVAAHRGSTIRDPAHAD
ncbi:MAG: chemotaxis response regulator protein-glutamate methylesterase [Acidobacteriota bacterium]